MALCSCSRSKRCVMFLMCGSVLTFLIQYMVSTSPKETTSVVKMFQSAKEPSKKYIPVIVKPPSVPLPGSELKTEQPGGGYRVGTQVSNINEPVMINPPVIQPSLLQNPVQFNGANQDFQPAIGNVYPQAPQVELNQVPPSVLHNWAQALSGQMPPMQGPVFNGNMNSPMQIPVSSGNVNPPMQGYDPNGNMVLPMQGPVPSGNMVPPMQQAVPSANVIHPMQQAVRSRNVVPPMQQAVSGGNMVPPMQGYVPDGIMAPLMHGPVASGNMVSQMQGQIQHNLISQMPGSPNFVNMQQQGISQYLPLNSQMYLPPPPGEDQVPDPRNEAEGGPETKILRWNGKGWTQLNHFCASKNMNLKRTLLRSPVGNAIIYIHNLKDDKYVSGSLKAHGLWDLADVTVMIDNLRSDPDLGFIDIGSHVGTFSLVAAIMGKKVVAVDPLVNNVIRFCKSVQANDFTDKISIFYTAISNGYKKVSFQRDIGNIGGTRIKDAPASVNTSNIYDPNFIDTVRLDDLLPHIPFKRAFMKMDVEEHEYEVVTSGVKFFQDIDVRGILMEWMWQKTGKNGLKLRDYLLGLHFKPYFPNGKMELQIEHYQAWPNDVLWKKNVI